jgi:hypothetical protein
MYILLKAPSAKKVTTQGVSSERSSPQRAIYLMILVSGSFTQIIFKFLKKSYFHARAA